MEPISFEMMVTEQRFEREAGRWPKSRAVMPREFVFLDGGKVAIDGELNFHGLDVPLGQRLKIEITLLGDGEIQPSARRREPIIGTID
jgi:hypothetical protein